MKQEDKELLFRYLSMALPYDLQVKIDGDNEPHYLLSVQPNKGIALILMGVNMDGVDITSKVEIDNIKPYLRPLPSMTDEEQTVFSSKCELTTDANGEKVWAVKIEGYDWLNASHLDYRGLIPMGLALEAPEDMY